MRTATARAVAASLIGILISPLGAQTTGGQTPGAVPPLPDAGKRVPAVSYGTGFFGDYRQSSVSAFDLQNSPRVRDLMRAGIIYLSLQDAVALALENNLDLQWERYIVRMSQTDTLRAKAGGLLRGLQLSAFETPAGLGGPGEPLLNSAATGSTPQTTVITAINDAQFINQAQDNLAQTPTTPFSIGPAVPQYDPSLNGQFLAQHATTPESSTLLTGSPSLVNDLYTWNAGYLQGFSSGATVAAGWNNTRIDSNSVRNLINPYYNSSLGVTITQPLLRGFGFEVNRRFIRMAKSQERLSEDVFLQQASITVAGVIRLYTDLVSLNEDLKVKQQTLATAQRLAEDNANKVDQGTLAPVELTRAQAQVAAARQDLVNSEGFVRQQELILKSVLVRDLASDPEIHDAHIVPTDPLVVADAPKQTRDELVKIALQSRPDYLASQQQIDITQTALKGSRNGLLPELDLVGNMSNAGLAGAANPTVSSLGGTPTAGVLGYNAGYGASIAQVFQRDYPSYSVGLNLTLPLRNRTAQADAARDELLYRQTQVKEKQLENTIRVQVEDALIALERTKEAYQAAVETRKLQEQSLEIEQERFNVGLSTNFLVIQYESYVAQARSSEVAAMGAYAKARTQLDSVMGIILPANGVSFATAYTGDVARTSTPNVK
ncbi:MAG: TolC family protein [Acidobacteriota bacterium]|nr:TolC family protein [Acidobacteriota bacterium]